jgi:citronellol/citronellal dehydrogenase
LAVTPPPSQIFAPGVLDGRVAIITGGGTGLGKASALELVACGASVVIAGRPSGGPRRRCRGDRPRLQRGGRRHPRRRRRRRIVAAAMERHGHVDLLVNNAGGQYFVPAEAIAQKGWNAVWNLNVGGTLAMTRAVVAGAMRAAGSGTIVNITLSPHHGLAG